MATFRIPVLIWQDFNGSYTAQAVTGEDYFPPAAYAEKRDAALAEVKEYLQWLFENETWRDADEFEELQLTEFRVEVRPEYKTKADADDDQKKTKKRRRTKEKTFTSDELVPLRVACLSWKTASGNYAASLPLLDIDFFFERESELKKLVNLKVQETLRGSTPLGLLRHLPPREIALEELAFQARRKPRATENIKETPTLQRVAEPLGAKDFTRRLAKPYEREAEIADLVARITKEKASIILLGESGTGKTAVLTEAARQIEKELLRNPDTGEDFDPVYDEKNPRHRFWQTNGGRLIAGMKYLGQWEERLEQVISELSDIDGVLAVENLLDLVRYGGRDPGESLAAFLVPYIRRGEVRIVAEATAAELDACRRLLPSFANLFQIVRLPEFSDEKALSVLARIADAHRRNHSVEYSANVVDLAYRFFKRFMPYRKFPGKTTHFLIDLFEKAAKERRRELTAGDVIDAFVRLTGLPELFLRDEVTLDLADVVAELESEVIGQDAACRQVANIVTTFKAGLNDPRRPLGVFLFAGPTGVGKTELAKSLARFFFGADERSKEKLVRLDMSEYNLGGAAARLLMKTDGEPSELIQQVREKPFSVVLFDEVEKADPQVFDVLLGLFDEGRLTDRFGRVTDFTSAVVIMTSNLGAERFARGEIGFGETDGGSSEKDIKAFFRPEFFNRLDAVVQFRPLDKPSLDQITAKELSEVAKREGLAAKGLKLTWTKAVVDRLASKGFDPRYGARPLQRTIETLLTAPLAEFLLARPELENARLEIDLAPDDRFTFKIQS
ncbi:MAG: ATP-dependent Clp protease ATP-binding subunit [Acidobacteria bacterium]|nr:ATP-dependent Clp protease ATP-binding subunit [Acidobacteriota bacterium]